MIIESVLLDKKRYQLVDTEYSNKNNAFTIIVGSNGTGKSRLLKRIVNNVKNVHDDEKIPHNYSRQLDVDLGGNKASFYSSPSESKSILGSNDKNIQKIDSEIKVIAVTTTPFDKFPVEYKGNEIYRYHDNHRYSYIGLKVSKNNLNQSNFINLLARAMLASDRVFNNKKLFSLLDLSSAAQITLKTKLPQDPIFLIERSRRRKNSIHAEFNEEAFMELIAREYISIYDKLLDNNKLITKAYHAYMKCLTHIKTTIDPQYPHLPKDELIFLLDIGLLNVSDIIFTNKKQLKLNISELSSGQKCMILTLLNIAGSITDNSIVCIDEPEISLHPHWQKEFMKILIEFFKDFKMCHFIIATHSPLIISELSNENCFILNMDLGYAQKACEYKNMSSDYQLAEVFGIAGNNNEYLNRIVVSLLSKLSKNGQLDDNDKIKIKNLTKLSKNMNHDDNVKQLIDILNLAWSEVLKSAK